MWYNLPPSFQLSCSGGGADGYDYMQQVFLIFSQRLHWESTFLFSQDQKLLSLWRSNKKKTMFPRPKKREIFSKPFFAWVRSYFVVFLFAARQPLFSFFSQVFLLISRFWKHWRGDEKDSFFWGCNFSQRLLWEEEEKL